MNLKKLQLIIALLIVVFIALQTINLRQNVKNLEAQIADFKESIRYGKVENYSVAKRDSSIYCIVLPSGRRISSFDDSLDAVRFIPKLVEMNIKSGIAR